jgi:hypothetical protein
MLYSHEQASRNGQAAQCWDIDVDGCHSVSYQVCRGRFDQVSVDMIIKQVHHAWQAWSTCHSERRLEAVSQLDLDFMWILAELEYSLGRTGTLPHAFG